jgi:hypothetical protein
MWSACGIAYGSINPSHVTVYMLILRQHYCGGGPLNCALGAICPICGHECCDYCQIMVIPRAYLR